MKTRLSTIAIYTDLLVFVGLSATLTNCSNKDDDPDPGDSGSNECTITQSEFIGTWIPKTVQISPEYDYGNGPTSNGMAHWDQCMLDDGDQFLSNGVYISDDGQDTCSTRHHEEGTWQYDAENCTITTDVQGVTEEWELISVTSSQLKARFRWSDGGIDYIETWTFDKL